MIVRINIQRGTDITVYSYLQLTSHSIYFKEKKMKKEQNYSILNAGPFEKITRTVLKDKLELTGSEISLNRLEPGKSNPFVHGHKRNEEVYIFVKGKGTAYIDGDEFSVKEGDVLRVDPEGRRCFKADGSSDLQYICIQTEKSSLVQHTREDGFLADEKPSWMK
jgi:mannose-6-phosphate isomerase-like protein (cupin superfamily)